MYIYIYKILFLGKYPSIIILTHLRDHGLYLTHGNSICQYVSIFCCILILFSNNTAYTVSFFLFFYACLFLTDFALHFLATCAIIAIDMNNDINGFLRSKAGLWLWLPHQDTAVVQVESYSQNILPSCSKLGCARMDIFLLHILSGQNFSLVWISSQKKQSAFVCDIVLVSLEALNVVQSLVNPLYYMRRSQSLHLVVHSLHFVVLFHYKSMSA